MKYSFINSESKKLPKNVSRRSNRAIKKYWKMKLRENKKSKNEIGVKACKNILEQLKTI